MRWSTCSFAAVLFGLLTVLCPAQTQPQPKNLFSQEAVGFPPPTWSLGPVVFGGLVDSYHSLNFNHPASGVNTLRNFDARADNPSINMAKISAEMAPAPVGFKFELGFGRAFDIFHMAEPGRNDAYRSIYQAYASLRPAALKGVQVDVGKFVTSAGSEVTESHLNWNYSRSLLFANGPYYHFGVRTTMPVTKNLTAGFQLVQGWNNIEDNNSGKTVGFTTAFSTSKLNWYNAYYTGPEKANSTEGYRHFYDTVLQVNPGGKVNWMVNFDYGQENIPGEPAYKFYGVSTGLRFLTSRRTAISPRYDWYNDRDGFITGQRRRLQEFTMTFDYKFEEGFLTRFEYRRDWSDRPYFDRGWQTGNARNMDTLLVGVMIYTAPKL